MTFLYEDALVISTVINNNRVHLLLVDDDTIVNILSAEVMVQIGIPSSKLTPVKAPFIGIESPGILAKGALELFIVMGTPPKCV